MATEVDRLVVVFDANFQRMEDKLNKVIRSNFAAAKKVEAAWGKNGDTFNQLGQAIGAATAKIPGVTALISALTSPIGLATEALAGLALAFHATTEAMQWADDLAAAAVRIGTTSEALQGLQYAAEANDIAAEDLGSSLEGLNRSIGALRSGVGDKKFIEAFAALKIKPEDMRGIHTATDLLPLLADRLSAVGSVAEQVQIAKKLGVEALLPLLRQGSEGIKELTDKARALGLVIDEGVVNKMADANEEMRVATTVIKANLIPIFADLAVGIGKVSTAIVELIGWFHDLQKAVPQIFSGDEIAFGIESAIVGPVQASINRAVRAAKAAGARPVHGHAPGAATVLQEDWTPPVKKGPKAAKAKALKMIGLGDTPIETERDINDPVNAYDQIHYLRMLRETANDIKKVDPFGFEGLKTPEDLFDPIKKDLAKGSLQLHDTTYSAIRGGLEAGFKDGLPGVLAYLQDALFKSVLDGIAEGLTSALLKGSGGSGGLVAAIVSVFGKRGYAGGTMSSRSGMALVGEHGPELVSLPGGSRVMSNSALRNMAMGGGRGVTQTVVFDNRGAVIWEQAARQMMSYADRAAAGSATGAVQIARKATPSDLARDGSRRLGR